MMTAQPLAEFGSSLRTCGLARAFAWFAILLSLVGASAAQAHPAPFSYLDLNLHDGRIDGTLTVHMIDVAHELKLPAPQMLIDEEEVNLHARQITAMLTPRLSLGGQRPVALHWTSIEPLREKTALRLKFQASDPGALEVKIDLFPYDATHQSFVNIYEAGTLKQQWIFGKGSGPRTYFPGTSAGAAAVIKTFVPSGIHHILIGPDHILFLVGLLLLGGSWKRLLMIVTSFTLGHSITLSLAALGILSPPAAIIEPAIALTIVFVGADNLLRGEGRDLRTYEAAVFGLVHGFGFANVLREFGLPHEALLLSLFSFNIGVELGQLLVVALVASVVDFIWRRSPKMAKRVAVAGSAVVIAAGSYWFIERVFFSGGI